LAAMSGAALLFSANLAARADEAKPEAAKPEAAKPEAKKGDDSGKVQAYGDALKARDPEAFKKFIEVREARDKAVEHLKKSQKELREAQGEEKMNAYQVYRTARKNYVTSYMAFLDFLDEQDKKRLEQTKKQCQAAQDRLQNIIETRKKAREELEKAMKD
jgi:hypothetical protein